MHTSLVRMIPQIEATTGHFLGTVNEKLLPYVVFGLKTVLLCISATILTTLTFWQFRVNFAPDKTVSIPLHLIFEDIPNQWNIDRSLRNEQILQGNFSLLTQKHLHNELKLGAGYAIHLYLELADYEVNYQEGMFLVCLKHLDLKNEMSWPIAYYWTPEAPSAKYGRCRSTILLPKGKFYYDLGIEFRYEY